MMALTNIVTESLGQGISIVTTYFPFHALFFLFIFSFFFRLSLDRLGLDLTLSVALPLIENAVIIGVEVIIFVIKDFFSHLAKTGDLLLHVDPGNAVGVQHLVEVGDDKTFQVEV